MKKGLLHKLFSPKEKWILQKADYKERAENCINPARGWYRIYTFEAEEKIDFADLIFHLEKTETLVLILINVARFQNEDFSQECLENMRRILTFFKENGKDIVLRVTYDHEGRAMEKEPSLFSQVRRHLEQVGMVLQEFPEAIFVYQGMLIGNWGEMHTSRFLGEGKIKQMAELLMEKKGAGTYLAVRRPMQWRLLNPLSEPGEGEFGKEVGLFDDAIFGSQTDMGTFGDKDKKSADWCEAWRREPELKFEELLCRNVPNGGEVIWGEGFGAQMSQDQLLRELHQMHITYLNSQYDKRILEHWSKITYTASGVWQGKTLLEYIGAHMGYRLLLVNVELQNVQDNQCEVVIKIQNTGFAAVYQDLDFYIEWQTKTGRKKQKKIEFDMQIQGNGNIEELIVEIEPEEGELYLKIQRRWDGRRIQLANVLADNGRMLLGNLKARTR